MMNTEMIDSMEQSKQMDFVPFLPADLSLWVAKETLVNLILSLVPTVEESKLRSVVPGHDSRALPPRMLLGLAVYAYAVGTYSSEVIAQKARQDQVFRYLSAHRPPDGEAIRRFRNRHRQVIAQCLATVCLVVWKIRRGNGEWRGASRNLRSLDAASLDPLTHTEIICEVMERLRRAEVEDHGLPGEEISTSG